MSPDALAPYDAVLVVSYGGPDGPDAVLPFLRNATAGRGIPDERLAEVGAHYALFGGVSPINARNAEFVDAVGAALASRGSSLPIVVGNRNWHPFLADTLRELDAAGARRVVCLLTSAYASYSSCRQYREDVERALDAAGATLEVDFVGPYAASDGFVAANADALAAVARPGARVLFVTHSIPVAMDAASGPGPEDERYAAQHRAVAARVIERAASRLGYAPEWELVFCSKSSAPVPWLEPDINDRLRELAAAGVTDVVAAPIGFASDHLEVVYDLDTQAAATASELGIRFARAATAGTHPAFVAELADRLIERAAVARGERPEPDCGRYRCAETCCLSGRPARPARG